MIRYIKTFSSILLIVAAFHSCTKKNTHHTVNSTMVAAFTFPAITYWVYRDSITGELDTFLLTGINSGSFQRDKYIQDYTYMSIIVKKRANQAPYGDMNFAFYENYCNLALANSNSVENNLGYIPLFTYPLQVGNLPLNDNAGALITDIGKATEIYPTFTIGGISYNNVMVANYQNLPGGRPIRNDWFYFVEKVGIVKMKFYHPDGGFIKTIELVKTYVIP